MLYGLPEEAIPAVTGPLGGIFIREMSLADYPAAIGWEAGIERSVAYGIAYEVNQRIFSRFPEYFTDAAALGVDWATKKSAPVIGLEEARKKVFELEPWLLEKDEDDDEYLDEAALRATVSLPLLQAVSQYPKLSEQILSTERIHIHGQLETVRPSLGNWIRAYRNDLGVGYHDPMLRAKFLFDSENGKKLSSEERERINLIVRSVEDNVALDIDTETMEIVFPTFQESGHGTASLPARPAAVAQRPEPRPYVPPARPVLPAPAQHTATPAPVLAPRYVEPTPVQYHEPQAPAPYVPPVRPVTPTQPTPASTSARSYVIPIEELVHVSSQDSQTEAPHFASASNSAEPIQEPAPAPYVPPARPVTPPSPAPAPRYVEPVQVPASRPYVPPARPVAPALAPRPTAVPPRDLPIGPAVPQPAPLRASGAIPSFQPDTSKVAFWKNDGIRDAASKDIDTSVPAPIGTRAHDDVVEPITHSPHVSEGNGGMSFSSGHSLPGERTAPSRNSGSHDGEQQRPSAPPVASPVQGRTADSRRDETPRTPVPNAQVQTPPQSQSVPATPSQPRPNQAPKAGPYYIRPVDTEDGFVASEDDDPGRVVDLRN